MAASGGDSDEPKVATVEPPANTTPKPEPPSEPEHELEPTPPNPKLTPDPEPPTFEPKPDPEPPNLEPASGPQPPPEPAPVPIAGQPIDLLKLIDVKRDAFTAAEFAEPLDGDLQFDERQSCNLKSSGHGLSCPLRAAARI